MRFQTSCAAVLATLLALTAHGQEVVSPEHASATAALEKRIVQLEDRLKKLEEKFEKPMTVKAPFIVADGGGKPIFQVSNTGGRSLTLGPDSAPTFKVSDGSNETLLTLKSAGNSVYLKAASGNASIVSVTNGKNSVRLISNTGVAVAETVQGGEVAQLGVMDGFSRIKLWKGDKPYLLATAKVDPRLTLGDMSNPEFDVMAGPNATTMRVAKGNYLMNVGATTHGAEVSIRDVQAGGTTITANPQMSSIRVHSATGSESLEMSLAKDEPALTLNKGGKRVAELGTPEANATGLRVYEPTGEIAVLAGISTEGKPAVAVYEKDEDVAIMYASDAGEGVLELSRKGQELTARLGRSDTDKGPGLRIFDTSGNVAVGASIDEDNAPTVQISANGKLAATMNVTTTGGGIIEVWQKGKSSAELTAEDDGNGLVALRNTSGKSAATLGSDGGEGLLELYRGHDKISASLGTKTGRKTALRLYNDAALVAAVGLDENNAGALNINDSAGKKAVVAKNDSNSGGAVIAYDKSEAMAAALAIDDKGRGAVEVHGDGQVLATLARGNNGGVLLLSNHAGQLMVQAGNNGEVGVVTAGPIVRAGGMMGIPGTYLKGRKQ